MCHDAFDLPEALASLTARATPPQRSVPGKACFSGVELAGTLARLSPGAWALAWLRYLDDRSAWPALRDAVQARLAPAAPRHPALLELALSECLYPPRCTACQGRGFVVRACLWHSCSRCGGAGWLPFSQARRARELGISRQAFAQHWAVAYRSILEALRQQLRAWEDEIRATLRAQLRKVVGS